MKNYWFQHYPRSLQKIEFFFSFSTDIRMPVGHDDVPNMIRHRHRICTRVFAYLVAIAYIMCRIEGPYRAFCQQC